MNLSGLGAMPDMATMRAMQTQMFSKADADQSGGLSLGELEELGKNKPAGVAGGKQMPSASELFASLDADQSGELSQSEMEAMRPPQMRMDTSTFSALLETQSEESKSPLDVLLEQLTSSSETDTQTASPADLAIQQIKAILAAYESERTDTESAGVTA